MAGLTPWRGSWLVDCAASTYTVLCSGGTSGSPGLYYAEATMVAANSDHKIVMGICNSSFTVDVEFTALGNGFDNTAGSGFAALLGAAFNVAFGAGNVLDGWGDTVALTSVSGTVQGDVIGIAVDTANRLLWTRDATSAPATWHPGGSPGVSNGLDISSITGPLYILSGLSCHNFGSLITPTITWNFGATAFAATIPNGATAWGAADKFDTATANTGLTFSADKLTISRSTQDPNAFGRFARTLTAH